ncbi:M56 family metallopeptidase [Wukongibacter baidiensis]|uniref:M56 family metallopeptidase n=1 Tax=Wukongibacter baidiensis TaxID=1723361 RepID=UPI003D7F6239
MDIIWGLFSLVLNSSLEASIVALLILLIKNLFRNAINARLHYLLWFLVLIRLLIPFLPESNLSLFNIFQPAALSSELDFEKSTPYQPNYFIDISRELSEGELYENPLADIYDKNNGESLLKQGKNTYFMVLSLTWFIGFLCMILLVFQSLVRIKLKTKHFNRVADKDILRSLNECRKKLGIHKEVPIYTGYYFKSPCTYGMLRPCIYYPQNMITNTNSRKLYHILLHELGHYKRNDHLGNLLGILALSIHWFNPIVWICIKRMRMDREFACDSYVLEVIGEEGAISYGRTIIESLENFSFTKPQTNLLFFYEQNNQFERRIKMIRNFKKGSYKISLVTIILFTIIGSVILTNAVTHEYDKNDVIQNPSTETANTPAESIYKDKTIVIDPGHGGLDPGALNPNLELEEKEVVLDVSLKLKELLEDKGFKVHITREDDKYIKLQERATFANELKADAFVSIHVNASSKSDSDGVQAFYSRGDDRDNKTLAATVKNSLVKKLEASDQGIIERPKLIVLRDTKMPAIILSIGFLTNPKEAKLLKDDNYRERCAEGAYNGIIEYFNRVLVK